MDLPQLFALQKRLDDRILDEHGLKGRDLTAHKILALAVELGELANETRTFKYWSRRQKSSPREVVLEEFVDCLHFLFTLGLDYGFTPAAGLPGVEQPPDSEVEAFLAVFDRLAEFTRTRSAADYTRLFGALLALGRRLGFSEGEVEAAYRAKNRVNHERQVRGY